jgi:hypothetical protein
MSETYILGGDCPYVNKDEKEASGTLNDKNNA